MPTTPHPLKVFLCHAHADKSAVRNLYRYLRERKIDAWLDAEKLMPGQNWQVEIPKALNSSDAIIVCLSKNSVDKEGYVQKEIKFALDKALEMPEGRIFLIPARLEECDLPYSLSAYHFVNLFEEDGYKRLLRSLRARAEQIGATKVGQITNVPHAEPLEPASPIYTSHSKSNPTNYEAEKIEREAVEKAEREKTELEAVEKAAREKLEQEVAQKAEREKAEREVKVEPVVKKPVATKPEPKKQGITKLPLWSIGLTTFAILLLAAWGLSSIPASSKPTKTPSATQTLFVEPATETPIPATETPMPATKTATITPTPTLGIGSTMISEKDGTTLVYVPEGEFLMGSKDTDSPSYNEKPQHYVTLDAFWIDQTEVTNAMYAKCMQAGSCNVPHDALNHISDPKYANHPVTSVLWVDASSYCSWAERRLPTEAEWEKAARGVDGRTYPWGNNIDCTFANYYDNKKDKYCVGGTKAVKSYESGKSPYGAYDMAGNVWEWVNDWYSETYYQSSPSLNPLGPTSGQVRVLRGGSWNDGDNLSRSAFRIWYDPPYYVNFDGFRCARSLP